MARLMIGRDSTGTSCIKIMKNNTDNPYSTPDTDYAKFSFNSKWETNVRFVGTDRLNYQDDQVQEYFPAGTNKNTFQRARIGHDTGTLSFYWKKEFWQSLGPLDYDLPVFDVKMVDNAGAYIYNLVNPVTGNFSTQYRSQTANEDGYVNNFFPGAGNFVNVLIPYSLVSFGRDGQHKRVSVWNLPADETAIVNPPLAPVPGQKTIQITSQYCRVAKPGYDVTTAIASQLAFDSTTRPAKIVAAGDIALPAGTTVFDFSDQLAGITLSGELVADVIQYKGDTVYFPASIPTDDGVYGASFVFSGKTLVFSNGGDACRARILIIAQDNSAATAGSNRVFRQITVNGVDVFQLIRPGAAEPPTLADIIIDSRWPCLQIIKTDVFNIPGGGAQETAIAFDSAGLFPFIKFFTIHNAGQPNSTAAGSSDKSAAGKRVRLPFVAAGFATNPNSGNRTRFISGAATYCRLTANEARFYTFRDLPYRYYYDQNSNNQYVLRTEDVSCPAYAIRYYIFGIPA